MIGEATLFTRSDEVEAAWRVVDPLIQYWEVAHAEADADVRRRKLGTARGG